MNRKNSPGDTPKSRRRQTALKKPRSLGGLAYFALENRDEINRQSRSKGRSSPGQGPLDRYRTTRQELWDALDPDTRALYQRRALDRNKAIVVGPPDEVIERYVPLL